jgi:hypothetical protein
MGDIVASVEKISLPALSDRSSNPAVPALQHPVSALPTDAQEWLLPGRSALGVGRASAAESMIGTKLTIGCCTMPPSKCLDHATSAQADMMAAGQLLMGIIVGHASGWLPDAKGNIKVIHAQVINHVLSRISAGDRIHSRCFTPSI